MIFRTIIRFMCISCSIFLTLVDEFRCEAIAKTPEFQFEGETITIAGTKISEYLGIRYAAPPVGNLRFAKPQPYTSGDIISFNINEPSACWQISSVPFPWYDNRTPKSEDCLFLNLWAPDDASPDNKKAVIYFVHEGGFRFGSIRQEIYNGGTFAALGDVIVVTVNYRVGPFGFLTSNTDDAPGNVGLWDVLEGLKWVNKNIEAFGGDKSRITIAGAGAGSHIVGLLSVSPLAEGLFRRQIMQSGSPVHLYKYNKETNLQFSQDLAKRLGCANETFTIQRYPSAVVDCIKKANPLVVAGVDSTIDPESRFTYFPEFGDELLPHNPTKSVLALNLTCNEVLIGNTLDEGSVAVTMHDLSFFGFFGQKDPRVKKKTGEEMIRDIFKNFTNRNAVVAHYLPSNITDDDSDTIRKQVYDAAGDYSVVCPLTYYAEKCAEHGGKVYYYEWRERPMNSPYSPWMGVAYGSELAFVFGDPLKNPDYFPPRQIELSKKIIGIWSSFAKTGDPGIPWPLYSESNPVVKCIGPNSTVEVNEEGPQINNCNFFRPYFKF